MSLAYGNHQGVKLVEEARLVLRCVGGKSLTGEGGQRLVAYAIAAGRGRQKMMPLTDTAQVLVATGTGWPRA